MVIIVLPVVLYSRCILKLECGWRAMKSSIRHYCGPTCPKTEEHDIVPKERLRNSKGEKLGSILGKCSWLADSNEDINIMNKATLHLDVTGKP